MKKPRTARKYRVMKYDGDDIYSYAIFRAADVKGMTSPIFYGQAKPIVAGLSRSEAKAQSLRMEHGL